MKRKINNIAKNINAMHLKVVEVTKDHYTFENGDVFEHTFEIDENVTWGENRVGTRMLLYFKHR